MGINWHSCVTSHVIFTCLASDVCYKKRIRSGVHLNMTHIILPYQSSNDWLVYYICQNLDKVHQERFFSSNHILCL